MFKKIFQNLPKILGFIIIVSVGTVIFSACLKTYMKISQSEREVFRVTEWFPTVTEALNWSLNEAPKRVKSYSEFIYITQGITVTKHEIIVCPSEKHTFGYDVVIIFYGVKEETS